MSTNNIEDTSDFLLPALTPENIAIIKEELETWSPDLINTIKTVNLSVSNLLDTELLKTIISTSFDFFIKTSKEYLDDIISNKSWNIWIENFIKYINLFYLLLNVKKIYNTSPKEDFYNFYNSEYNDQLLKLIIPKWKELPFLDITTWWSCHNFSILFKDFFDKLWMKSKIIFCNPVSNHSFLVVNIMWEYYSVDPLFRWKEFIKKIKKWDKIRIGFDYIWEIVNIDPIFNVEYFNIKDPNKHNTKFTNLKTEKSAENFSKKLDNRKIKYIIFETYIETLKWTFRIYIWNENWNNIDIDIYLWKKEVHYTIKKNKLSKIFNNINKDISNNDILSLLINYVYKFKWKKQSIKLPEILSEIKLISDMIKRKDLIKLLGLSKKIS